MSTAENPHVIPGLPIMLPEPFNGLLEARVLAAGLPEHMHEGIIAYLRYGRPCGDFLRAVLCNDARDAMRRADEANAAALGNWFLFLIRYAPMIAWGSQEHYDGWLEAGRAARKKAAEGGGQ
jgi:hypothetical protein